MAKKPNHRPKTLSGFSLIEVLVALLVLAIGLLGLAGMQVAGLKMNHQSYQRTQAVVLAYDILDRIRANPAGKNAGHYNSVSESAMPSVSSGQCLTAVCTPQEMADYDIKAWKTMIAELLPEGTGSLATSGARRTVTIKWKEGDGNVPMQVDVEVEL